MATVGTKIGFTLRISKDSQFEFIRPEISIENIEIDGSKGTVASQLDLAEKAVKETWDRTTKLMNEEILSKMGQVNAEMELQINKKLSGFKTTIDELRKEIEGLKGAKKK